MVEFLDVGFEVDNFCEAFHIFAEAFVAEASVRIRCFQPPRLSCNSRGEMSDESS